MLWLVALLGYFLGAIPTAYIAARWFEGRDIRQMGDGNVGANNAFRQLGPKVGIVVGIIDAAKGALAILIAQAAGIPQPGVLLAGAAAVIGYNWPIFLGFRGGRGLSTTIGVLYALITQPMLIITVPAFAALFILRDVSKAAAIATFLFLPVCWWLNVPWTLIPYSIALLCLVGLTHFIRTRRPLVAKFPFPAPVKGLKTDSTRSGSAWSSILNLPGFIHD